MTADLKKFNQVTEENIKVLVDEFYAEIKKDQTLGPIFNREIGDGWASHMPRMYDFWSSVMLKSGRYHGRPVPVHMKIEGLSKERFIHWLKMFHRKAHELYEEEIANIYVEKSNMIAQSLQFAIGLTPSVDYAKRPKKT
jgi:hemoglobin